MTHTEGAQLSVACGHVEHTTGFTGNRLGRHREFDPWEPCVLPLRYFLDGTEVDEATARDLEARHCARVSQGASAVVPERLGGGDGPWMELSALVSLRKVISDLRIVVNLGGSAEAMLATYESRLGKVEPVFGWDRFDPSEAVDE